MGPHFGHWDAFSMYRLATAIASGDYSVQDDALTYDDRPSYAAEPVAEIKAIDFSALDIMTIAYGVNDFTGNTHSALGGDYFMCRETPCVSVIVECGFLSNAEETALLKTDDYRATFCNEILRGVLYYLSEEKLG